MNKMKNLGQIKAGQRVVIKWKTTDFYHACCDCGLTHKMTFRVEGEKLIIRSWRSQKMTRKWRRKCGIKLHPDDF